MNLLYKKRRWLFGFVSSSRLSSPQRFSCKIMKKLICTLLTTLSLVVLFSSCQNNNGVEPITATTKHGANYTVDGGPQTTKIGSTNLGDVYMTTCTQLQVNQAWQALAAHREISYAGFDTTQIYYVTVPGSATRHYVFDSVNNCCYARSRASCPYMAFKPTA